MSYLAAKKSKENLLDKVVVLGSSLVYLTKDTADDVIETLEKNNIFSEKHGKEMADKIRNEVKTRKEHVRKGVISQLRGVIDELGIATKEDVEALKKEKKTKK